MAQGDAGPVDVEALAVERGLLDGGVDFILVEQDLSLPVSYAGTEPPPDTFKDNSQALAEGSFGKDGVFHAKGLQAKCASKYAPAKPGDPASGAPNAEPPKNMTERDRSSKVGVTL